MCSFNYGGQSYETLDYSVMSSTPRRSYTEGTKSFNSRAEQEMRELEPEDYKHPFINVYSESGYVYHTGEPKKALRLSLVGQDYIYSPSVKKMTFSSVMAVYYRTGCSYRQLWKLGRFVPEICPIFLNKKKLSDIMLTIFKKVQIRLGQLQEKGISFIAWEIETEKVIEDKRKDTKTSESTALPCEQSYIDWNNSVARKNGKLYFAIEIKDFIDAYNYCYYQDYGKKYIQSLVTWYSYKQDFGRLKGDMCYEYTENKKILTLPTVAVYTIKHTKNIEAITVNFDDHSYTEKMYKKYEKLCFYCLKMLFPNMEKNKITSLYKKLNKKAYDHIFQTEKGFHSYNLPSDLYYRDGVGIYPYFAYGESVRMCIIPVDQKLIRSYRKKGVRLHRLDERKMKGI